MVLDVATYNRLLSTSTRSTELSRQASSRYMNKNSLYSFVLSSLMCVRLSRKDVCESDKMDCSHVDSAPARRRIRPPC